MRRGRLSNFTAGLIALVVLSAAIYLGFTKSIPFRSHYEIKAAFSSSNNIRLNSPVRIAGVEVGRVTKVEPMGGDANAALLTLRINDEGRPVHRDATAKIRPRIFLEGNFFVDMTAGSPGEPELGDGDTIPVSQTATPVQFDQVLNALKRPNVEDLRLTLGELAESFDSGLAPAFRRSLADQAPAYRFSAIVLDAIQGRRPRDLSGVVRDLGTVSSALNDAPELQNLLTDFNTFAASLAREQAALGRTVEELPRTLAAAGPAFDALNASFPSARRLAREALPGVRSSRPTIAVLRPLVSELRGLVGEDEARGLARDLSRATPGLAQISRSTPPLLRELRSIAACANNQIIPWSNDTIQDPNFPATGRVHEEAVKWLPGLAGESRSFDANGQWFKVLGAGGAETFSFGETIGTSELPITGTNPPKPTSRPPLEPEEPCEDQEQPDLRTQVGQPPQRVRTDWNSPRVQERLAKSRETAVNWLREVYADEGIDLEVGDDPATLEQVLGQIRASGKQDQLDWLKRKAAGR
jgi:phospholipid/cholesterol/gamma-HCH transport system substrate-binding protein